MKKLYYINTNAYDCIVSADEETNIVRMFPDNHFPDEWLDAVSDLRNQTYSFELHDNALFYDFLNSVEDDSSWEELDINANEIESAFAEEGSDVILAVIETDNL